MERDKKEREMRTDEDWRLRGGGLLLAAGGRWGRRPMRGSEARGETKSDSNEEMDAASHESERESKEVASKAAAAEAWRA